MPEMLRDLARRFAALVGVLLNIVGAVLFLQNPPTALPAGSIAAGVVVLGTAVLGWALWDGRNERAALRLQLDDRAKIAAALVEFRLRLHEGNELARNLPNFIFARGPLPQDEDKAKWVEAVAGWNAACRETVEIHYSHRTPIMDAPIHRAEGPSGMGVVLWAFRLNEEVAEKIQRMADLQNELAQSSRAAIS